MLAGTAAYGLDYDPAISNAANRHFVFSAGGKEYNVAVFTTVGTVNFTLTKKIAANYLIVVVGGGANGEGGDGNGIQCGSGGAGSNLSAYFGTSVGASGWFAGGGGGGARAGSSSCGSGGQGGGAAGRTASPLTVSGYDGKPTTGGGGGGLAYTGAASGSGGKGGSGIVIIRYTTILPSGTVFMFR